MEPFPEMLTTREVADLLQSSTRTVLLWTKRGDLISVRPTGGKRLYPINQTMINSAIELEQWKKERKENYVE